LREARSDFRFAPKADIRMVSAKCHKQTFAQSLVPCILLRDLLAERCVTTQDICPRNGLCNGEAL